MLAKLARDAAKRAASLAQVGVMLKEDERFSTLIQLVGVHSSKLGAQGVANVLNGLATYKPTLACRRSTRSS
jgi:hypothetical protein